MLLRIFLLPVFLLEGFPVAMVHYRSFWKCIKYWVVDGCKDVMLK